VATGRWPTSAPENSDLGNYALLCGFCHDNVHHRGFTIDMVNGKPVWVEPAWLRQPTARAA
jgi:hypothetical protein